jgi:hypothetical protein
MPHVTKDQKDRLKMNRNTARTPLDVGELAYVLAYEIDRYTVDVPEDLRFQRIAEVLGALTSVQAEYIERVHKPYEAHKARLNGSAFDDAQFEVERVTTSD